MESVVDLRVRLSPRSTALEEVLFRSALEGVIFKLAVYPETYPLAAVRHRVHAMYGLPAGERPDEPVRPLRAT